MTYRLANDVRLLSLGVRWSSGRVVSPSEIPPALWQRWIDDGVLVADEEPIDALRARAKEAGIDYYWAKSAETLREELGNEKD